MSNNLFRAPDLLRSRCLTPSPRRSGEKSKIVLTEKASAMTQGGLGGGTESRFAYRWPTK